jgi:RNA polymerase sigma factor (sigma-70 family)
MMKTREFNPKWVEDAKNGDQEAITQLYHYSYQAVYLTIKSMLRSEEDTVLDLVQDVFLKAFERLEQLENADRFQAWVKQIARNKVLDYQKKSKAVLFSELAAEDGEGDVLEFEVEDTSSYHLPDLALDKQETVRLIREILDSLPEGQRIVVGLYYYQNLSIKEIAELLERSEGTVKSQLHYGRKTIEKKVNELEQRDNIKLHSMAPLPFLLYLLRSAEDMPIEPNEAILKNVLRSNAGTTQTATAGKAAPSQTVAGAVSKAAGAAGKGIALKITGAVLAVALIGGGTAAIINGSQMQSDGEPTDSSAAVQAETSTLETESEAGMESVLVPEYTGFANELEAYRELLQTLSDDPNTVVQFSHLLDMDGDGVDEMYVLLNGDEFQLYRFSDGETELLWREELLWTVTIDDWEYSSDMTYQECIQTYEPGTVRCSVYPSTDNSAIFMENSLPDDDMEMSHVVLLMENGDLTGAVFRMTQSGEGITYYFDGEEVSQETFYEQNTEVQQEWDYYPSDDTDQILGTAETMPERSEDYQAAMNAYADKLYELSHDSSGDTQPHFQLVYLDEDNIPELAVADASFGKGTQQVFYQWNPDTGAAEKLGGCGCYGCCYYLEREGCTYTVISGDSLVSNEYYSLQDGTLQLEISRSFYVSLDTGAEENNTYTVEGREVTESDFLAKLAELTGETTEEDAVSKFTLLTYDDGYEITTGNIKAVLGV